MLPGASRGCWAPNLDWNRMSTLYLVATPIGNLEDITLRALRVLREVTCIAAEDTRRTRQLLAHFGIQGKTLLAYHEHNERQRTAGLLARLAQGDVALVSDAGTPLLNDPGYGLVRAALDAGHRVVPVPGPSAPLAALIVSGLPTDSFLYLGYLPRRAPERRARLREIAGLTCTLIALETPHRLLAALDDIQHVLGDRDIAVARELTKVHEEVFRGTVTQAQAHFRRQAPRGEFTLVIAGAASGEDVWDEAAVRAAVRAGLQAGEAPSRLAQALAAQSGWARQRIYQLVLEAQGQHPSPEEPS